jgi:hypothetical protein
MNKHWLRKDYGFTRPQWYPPYEFLNTMKLE